jgi:hypothetical protein
MVVIPSPLLASSSAQSRLDLLRVGGRKAGDISQSRCATRNDVCWVLHQRSIRSHIALRQSHRHYGRAGSDDARDAPAVKDLPGAGASDTPQ